MMMLPLQTAKIMGMSSDHGSPFLSRRPLRRQRRTTPTIRQQRRTLLIIWRMVILVAVLLAAVATVSQHPYYQSSFRPNHRRRNPFQVPRRRRLGVGVGAAEDTTTNTGTDEAVPIRYLSLGGASTWGVGLANPEPVLTMDAENGMAVIHTHDAAYPYQLSPDVYNAAQRVGGPTLAALCTQSIVVQQQQQQDNDDERIIKSSNNNNSNHNHNHNYYDVITLEFSTSAYQESDLVALDLLAHRLRQRFPNAVLVIVQLWSPSHYYYYYHDDGGETTTIVDFATWRRRQQQQRITKEKDGHDERDWSWDSIDWQVSLQEREWKYSPEVSRATARLTEIAERVQGQVVNLAPPQDPVHGLATANKWFTEITAAETVASETDEYDDSSKQQQGTFPYQYTLSSKGHLVVANHIRSYVDQAHILERTLGERNLLADWGESGGGDQCQLWYDYDPNGERSSMIIPKHSSSLALQAFDAAGDKYALEVPYPKGGSIIVENSFDEDRMFYLTYMTSSVPSSSSSSTHKKVYPQVQVQLVVQQEGQLKNLKKGGGVVVDPYHDDPTDRRHVTRTTAIGTVPALSSVEIRIQPLEETLAPFRLVGASFLAKEKVQWQIATEYDLEPERVHAERPRRRRSLRMLQDFRFSSSLQ